MKHNVHVVKVESVNYVSNLSTYHLHVVHFVRNEIQLLLMEIECLFTSSSSSLSLSLRFSLLHTVHACGDDPSASCCCPALSYSGSCGCFNCSVCLYGYGSYDSLLLLLVCACGFHLGGFVLRHLTMTVRDRDYRNIKNLIEWSNAVC